MEGVEDLTGHGLVAAGVGVAIVPLNAQLAQFPIHVLRLHERCMRSVSWRGRRAARFPRRARVHRLRQRERYSAHGRPIVKEHADWTD